MMGGCMNAEDLVIAFRRNMAKLSGAERRRAIESVRDVIRAAAFDDAAGSACEVERCPRCGSVAVVKKGKSKNGEQRYLCRGCGRTFGMGSERILGTSRLPKEAFMATDSGAAERTVARQLAHGACGSRVRDMFNVEPPYMDY